MASARTSDHQPIPMQATPSDRHSSLPLRWLAVVIPTSLRSTSDGHLRRSANRSPNRRRLRRRRWRDASAVNQHQHAPSLRRPPFRSGGERQPDRALTSRSATGRAARPWSGAGLTCAQTAFSGAGVHGVEAAAVHSLDQDHMPAGVHNGAGDRDVRLAGHFTAVAADLLRA